MKLHVLSIVLLPLLAAGTALADDETELRQAIENYVVGWREADHERLAKVFAADDGHVIWTTTEDGVEKVDSMSFAEILAREPKPNPDYGSETKILSLDVVDGRLAVAKVDISRKGGSYVDVLLFYKVGDNWKLVTKTFVSRRD